MKVELKIEKSSANASADLSRLIALSDGVFAIALTLLVLEIKVPGGATPTELPRQLAAMLPKLLTYLVSFLVIGAAWDGHQRTLRQVKQADSALAWLNLLMLLFVTTLPATAALLGEYPTEPIAVAAIALNGCLVNLMQWLMWRHVTRGYRLVNVELPPSIMKQIAYLIGCATGVFGLSAVVALINIPLAYVMLVGGLAATYIYASRIGRRRP